MSKTRGEIEHEAVRLALVSMDETDVSLADVVDTLNIVLGTLNAADEIDIPYGAAFAMTALGIRTGEVET